MIQTLITHEQLALHQCTNGFHTTVDRLLTHYIHVTTQQVFCCRGDIIIRKSFCPQRLLGADEDSVFAPVAKSAG